MLPKTIFQDLDYFLCFICYSTESLYITKCYHIHCNICIKEIRLEGRNDIFIKCLTCNLDTEYQPLSQKYLTNISVYKSIRVLEMQKEAALIMIQKLNKTIKEYERLLEEVYKHLKEKRP